MLRNKLATRSAVVTLIVVFALCQILFIWRAHRLGLPPGVKVLDARMGYSIHSAKAFFGQLDPNQRRLYAITEMTIDLLYPISYSLLLAVFISRLLPEPRWLVLIPIAGGCADLLENATMVVLALRFDSVPPVFYWLAVTFNVLKWILDLASVAVLLVGVIRFISSHLKPAT